MVSLVSDVCRVFFGGIWKLFLSTDYPGIGVSVAGVAISFLLIRLSISVFRFVSGFGSSSSDYGRAANSVDRYKSYRRSKTIGLPPH